jgi:hypothetical protein
MNIKPSNSGIFSAAALLWLSASLILAGDSHAWHSGRRLRDQIAEYHAFMQSHPRASTEIQQNPQLVHNRRFLRGHPEVDHFLKGRPELREVIASDPDLVFGYYGGNDRYHVRRHDRDDRRWRWRDR